MGFTSVLLVMMVLGIVQDTLIVCILLIRIYTCFTVTSSAEITCRWYHFCT